MIRSVARFVLVITMVIVLTGCALLPSGSARAPARDEPTPTPIPTPIVPTVPTYTVQQGEVTKQLQATGRISPVIEEQLFFRTSGRVRNVNVRRGDFVEEGQVLADLEIEPLERELASAQLELERAQVRLEAAERRLENDIRRAEVNVEIAQLNLDAARAQGLSQFEIGIRERQVALAQINLDELAVGVDPLLRNDVDRARLAVQRLEASITDAQIIAPFDGQVLSLTLSAGRPIEGYNPAITIADPTELEVSLELLSAQLRDLAEGMAVTAVLVNRPGLEIGGHIRRLPYPYGAGAGGGGDDSSTRVALDATAGEAGFELGDLVRVTIVLEHKDDVLWLPTHAVRAFEGRRFVVVQEGEGQRRVDVTLGIQGGDRVEIVEGVEEGQVVIGQ